MTASRKSSAVFFVLPLLLSGCVAPLDPVARAVAAQNGIGSECERIYQANIAAGLSSPGTSHEMLACKDRYYAAATHTDYVRLQSNQRIEAYQAMERGLQDAGNAMQQASDSWARASANVGNNPPPAPPPPNPVSGYSAYTPPPPPQNNCIGGFHVPSGAMGSNPCP